MKFQAFALIFCLLGLAAAHAECTDDPKKSMLSRVVAIGPANGAAGEKTDTGAPESAPYPLELNDKEIVLTFDEGPHAKYTDYILFTLDRFCAKAVFFFSWSAALANPAIVHEAAARGHTVAVGPQPASAGFAGLSAEAAKTEIEKGFAAVEKAAGGKVAPFFRAPSSGLAPDMMAYLKARGVSLWPYGIASEDTGPEVSPAKFQSRTLAKIRKAGKGIIQFHDRSKVTVDELDDILAEAKRSGFKVVQPVAGTNFVAKPEYLAGTMKDALKARTAPKTGGSLTDASRQKAKGRGNEPSPTRLPSWSPSPAE